MAARSDLEALSAGFRTRALVLGLVLAGGVGAAIWSGTREHGEGEPESRQRLMVVTASDGIDYYAVLERGGFELEVDRYQDALAGARAALPDSEAEGLALVVEHADIQGIGYVVLEGPGALSFAGLELDPMPADIDEFEARDYAVISVGDLAFPHHLSVDEVGEHPLVRLPGYGALEALFAQPSLLAREEDARPSIEELQFESAIRVGERMVERPAHFVDDMLAASLAVAGALAEQPDAVLLVPPMSAGTAVPMTNGGVLVAHHELEAYSEDAKTLSLHPGELLRLSYLGPAQIDALAGDGDGSRELELGFEPCTSLAEGEVELSRGPQLEAAVDGSALALTTRVGDTTIWHADPGPGCAWRERGRIDGGVRGSLLVAPRVAATASDGADERGAVLALAQVQTTRQAEPGRSRIVAWTLVSDRGPGQALGLGQVEGGAAEMGDELSLARVELLSRDEGRFAAMAIVDAHHLAVLSSTPLAPELATSTQTHADAVHILDVRAPGAHLRIPAGFIAEPLRIHELATLGGPRPVGAGGGVDLVVIVSRSGGPREPALVHVSGESWAEFVSEAPRERDAGPTRLYTLTPGDLAVEWPADGLEGVHDHALGQGSAATLVALTQVDGPHPSEIGLLRMTADGGWSTASLTHNSTPDRLPRVGADARYLTFSTLVRQELSAAPYSVPRLMVLGANASAGAPD